MTPFAQRVMKILMYQKTSITESGRKLMALMGECQYFDVGGITAEGGLAFTLNEKMSLDMDPEETKELLSTYAFLPAPIMWVEGDFGYDLGFIFEDTDEGIKTSMVKIIDGAVSVWSYEPVDFRTEPDPVRLANRVMWAFSEPIEKVEAMKAAIHQINPNYTRKMLPFSMVVRHLINCAIINTPDVVESTFVHTHKGLVKDIRRVLGDTQARKLSKGYHTYNLHVLKPRESDDHEWAATGTKALHYVKKFFRFKRGKLEYVRGHWRGNAANGVAKKVYMVVP